ncbi:response regulator transcription factor [Paenibacillus methanolicus]|nr:response regulator transcription factor [Paenibacillus methanolicus]
MCRRIRDFSKVPIMLVSAKSADWDKVHGMDVGADDYITKPFSPVELVARVKAHLRRASYTNEPPKAVVSGMIMPGGLIIDHASRSASLHGQPIRLAKTEFEILLLLARHPNRVFPADEIYERVWDENGPGSHNAVMVHISRLREKLGQVDGETEWISNVWGVPHLHLHHQRQDPTTTSMYVTEGLPLYFRDVEGPRMPLGGVAAKDGKEVLAGDRVAPSTP